MHLGMARSKGGRQCLDHRHRGWDRGQLQLSGKSVLESMDLLPHGTCIASDPACPFEPAIAFRGGRLETGTAVDEKYAERVFELLDPCGQRRLRYPTSFGRPPKVLFACQGEQKFELIEQGCSRGASI